MTYVIWYHLYNFKNMENTHREVLLLVKLQVSACNFTISNNPLWVFLIFLMVQDVPNRKASHMLLTDLKK